MSKEEFMKMWGSRTFTEIRDAAMQQGVSIHAKSKADALEEVWSIYLSQSNVPNVEPTLAPAPKQPDERVADRLDQPASTDAPVLESYEARCFGLNVTTRVRAGYVMTRQYAKLVPNPTLEQLAKLKADPVLQIRLAR